MLLITPNFFFLLTLMSFATKCNFALLVIPLPPPQDCTSSLLGPSLRPAPPQSSVAPALLRPSEFPPTPRSPKPPALPWRSRSSTSLRLIGFPSPPCAPPLPAPSVGPMEPLALHPPWLLPPSAPPWAAIMAVAWVPPGSSKSLRAPPWLLPPFDYCPPAFLPALCHPLSPSLLHSLCPPPKSPSIPHFVVPAARGRAFREWAICHTP